MTKKELFNLLPENYEVDYNYTEKELNDEADFEDFNTLCDWDYESKETGDSTYNKYIFEYIKENLSKIIKGMFDFVKHNKKWVYLNEYLEFYSTDFYNYVKENEEEEQEEFKRKFINKYGWSKYQEYIEQ